MIRIAAVARVKRPAANAMKPATMASLPILHVSCASKQMMNTLMRVGSVNSVMGIAT